MGGLAEKHIAFGDPHGHERNLLEAARVLAGEVFQGLVTTPARRSSLHIGGTLAGHL